MTTLLQLTSSLSGPDGQSSQLAERLVAEYQARHDDVELVTRDLAATPVPHLDAAAFAAFTSRPEQRTAEQARLVAASDRLIDELRAADVIVLGLPMYNFGVPSVLKAYFDQIARAGVTFRYTAEGAEGLLTGKKAYVVTARGGLYQGTAADTQSGYVRQFLAFLGITDVTFVYAEGLALGEAQARESLAAAQAQIAQLIDASVAARPAATALHAFH